MVYLKLSSRASQLLKIFEDKAGVHFIHHRLHWLNLNYQMAHWLFRSIHCFCDWILRLGLRWCLSGLRKHNQPGSPDNLRRTIHFSLLWQKWNCPQMAHLGANMAIPSSCRVILPGDLYVRNASSGCHSTSNERPQSNTFRNRYVSFSAGGRNGIVLCRNMVANVWQIPGDTSTRKKWLIYVYNPSNIYWCPPTV